MSESDESPVLFEGTGLDNWLPYADLSPTHTTPTSPNFLEPSHLFHFDLDSGEDRFRNSYNLLLVSPYWHWRQDWRPIVGDNATSICIIFPADSGLLSPFHGQQAEQVIGCCFRRRRPGSWASICLPRRANPVMCAQQEFVALRQAALS